MNDLPHGWRFRHGAYYLRTYVEGRQREIYLGKTMDAALHRYQALMNGEREGVFRPARDGDRPSALYRHFDADGNLLYVGVSFDVFNRTSSHLHAAPWRAAIAQITIERFGNRGDALRAEWRAIHTERPKYNIGHAKAPLLGLKQGGRSKKRGDGAP